MWKDFFIGAFSASVLCSLVLYMMGPTRNPSESVQNPNWCNAQVDPLFILNTTQFDSPAEPPSTVTAITVLLWTPLAGRMDNWKEHLGRQWNLTKDGEFNLEFITERDRVDEAKVILYNLNDLNLNLYVGGVRSASTWRQNELPNKKNRNPDQVWALFWREPPSKCRIEQHQLAWLDGIFNWTISYRRDSDVNYPFGYLKQVEHIKNLGAKWSTYLTKRMGVAWHSDTCDTVVPPPTCISAGGEEVALALADDGNHIYGSCINRTVRLPLGTTGEAALSSRARFYVAFEEEICDDYITERYFRALHHGYVPLVLGGADVGYDEVALAGTYIDAIDFVTEEGPLGLRRHLAELPWLEFSQYLLWQLDYTVDSCQGQWRLRLGEKVVADMARQKKSILDFSQFWHSKKCYGRYNTAKFH